MTRLAWSRVPWGSSFPIAGVKHLAELAKQSSGFRGLFRDGAFWCGGVEHHVVHEDGEDERTARGGLEIAGQCLAGHDGFPVELIIHPVRPRLGVSVAAGRALRGDGARQRAIAAENRQRGLVNRKSGPGVNHEKTPVAILVTRSLENRRDLALQRFRL